MKQVVRIVELHPELQVSLAYPVGTCITAEVTLQDNGARYKALPLSAKGPVTFAFDPQLQPLHAPPFTVNVYLAQHDLHVRRAFVFEVGPRGWSIWDVIRPELLDGTS